MANKTNVQFQIRNRTATSRSGFSMLEIVMVLAVFIVISGLAMPAIGRAFSGQHLRSAADVVRAGFSEARVKSMQTGDVYGFFYSPGTGQYFVTPMAQGFRSIRDGVKPESVIRELENGIVFVSGQAHEDSRSQMATEQATSTFSGMRPVLFYPDGTSQTARVLLQSSNSSTMIQVDLRGLTGTSSKSRLLSPSAVN